jgi:endoplasmic reticulum-Golgi intermediate compartment protein 2
MEIRKRILDSESEAEKPESFVERVQNLDVFPKYPPECTKTTISGGGISIVTFVLITLLTLSEIKAFFDTRMSLRFEMDKEFTKPVSLHLDMTVAMPCAMIGADIIDITGKSSVETEGSLQEQETWFEMSEQQHFQFQSLQRMNHFIRSSQTAVHHLLWRSGNPLLNSFMPDESEKDSSGAPLRPFNACRYKGHFVIPKVGGNFHIIMGKPLQFSNGGHAHISLIHDQTALNFSHRIHHLSFGDDAVGRIHPLDGEEFISTSNYQSFQYFVKVVPTKVRTRRAFVDTYQFSVSEQHRVIDHTHGSHGLPGIFMKYDFFPLTAVVLEDYDTLLTAFIKWAAGVGGIFATSGLLQQLLSVLIDFACCRLRIAGYQSGINLGRNVPVSE